MSSRRQSRRDGGRDLRLRVDLPERPRRAREAPQPTGRNGCSMQPAPRCSWRTPEPRVHRGLLLPRYPPPYPEARWVRSRDTDDARDPALVARAEIVAGQRAVYQREPRGSESGKHAEALCTDPSNPIA